MPSLRTQCARASAGRLGPTCLSPPRSLAASVSFPSFAGFLPRLRRAAGSGRGRSPAPRRRAGRRLAGACLVVGLTLGVSDPAFAGNARLHCPDPTPNEGDTYRLVVIHTGANHPFDGIFTTTDGTAGSTDYTQLNNWKPTFTTNQGATFGVDPHNAKVATAQTTEDTAWENDETFTVTMTDSLGSTENPLTCTITIRDDDGPTFTPSSGALVSNFSQRSNLGAELSFNRDAAQAFTTGSSTNGYVLTGVDLALRGGMLESPGYDVHIHNPALAAPLVGTLTNPAWTTGDRTARFTASPSIHLAASTTYRVVVDVVSRNDSTSFNFGTNSNAEDVGAAAGWSIADSGLWRQAGNTSWESRTAKLKIAIHATAVPATATAPGAPASPTVQVQSATSLLVAWKAPANDGDTAILDYDLRYYAGSEDPTAEADWIEEGETGGHTHTGTDKTATITGLSKNTAYRVQVRAQNAIGEGAWSASVWAATVPPGAPAAPTVQTGSTTSLRVAWQPPAIDGGTAPITDCDVRWRQLYATTWTELDDTTASLATRTSITGLTAGETYEVQVRAQNVVGNGAWSASTRGQTYATTTSGGGTLVSNLGQSGSYGNLKDKDYRITFRTGSHPGGYTLTGVVVEYQGLGAADADAVFHSIAVSGDGKTIELAPKSNPLVNGNNTWRINRGSGDLEPDTAYQVLLNVVSQDLGLDGTVSLTASNSVELGATDGWSITASESRNWDATAWSTSTDKLKFAITGTRKGAVRPMINLVRVVSAPTHDADGGGDNDTYVEGDEILIDVEFRSGEAVKVDTQGDSDNVALRVDMGGTTKKFAFDRVLHGYETLRFAYTVEGGNGDACNVATTTADCDTDGIALAPGTVNSVAGTLVELSNGASVMSADTFVAADLRYAGGLFQGVAARLKVDGGTSAADSTAGPRATAAEIPAGSQGRTLRVTFDKPLGPFDQGWVQYNLSIKASNVHTLKTQYQHPTHVARSTKTEGGATRGVLTLTLGVPVRAADRVYLGYGYVTDDSGRVIRELKGTGDPPKLTPDFANFPVVNNLPGSPPIPTRADIAGTSLTIMFDKALDPAATPAGSAFTVACSDRDYLRHTVRGTGTAAVEGSEVTVTLDAPVSPDELASVYYDPTSQAAASRLKGAGGGFVTAIELFDVRQVQDVTAPKLLNRVANILQTRASDPQGQGKSKIMLYFDERLDRTSVPAAGDFALSSTDSRAVQGAAVASVAVADTALVLTTSHWLKDNIDYTLAYTPGTNPVMDPAGNAVAAFTETVRSFAIGQPVLRGATVAGSRLELSMVNPLDPGSVPPPSAFALWEKDPEDGETELRGLTNHAVSVLVNYVNVVLQLDHPVYPCAGEQVFRVSYTLPSSGDERLRTAAGWGAAGWTANKWRGQTNDYALVTNARHARCADWWAGTYVGSVILKASRPFATHMQPKSEWFAVSASGGPVTATGAAFAADDPKVLRLTLSREFAPGETVTVSYRRPVGESGLWDADGNQLRDVVNEPVRASGAPALSVADAQGTEGGTLAFAVTLDVASTANVTVDYATADGSAAAAHDYTALSGTLTFAPGETAKTVEVQTLPDTAPESDETLTLTLSNALGATLADSEAAGTIRDVLPPLTASLNGLPQAHDGGRLFAFEIRFSEEFDGLRLTALEAGALMVTGGRLVDTQRTVRGQNRSVTVRVRPSGTGAVRVELAATADCTAATAICTSDGRTLSAAITAAVPGPATPALPVLGVADAGDDEGGTLAFAVTLSEAATGAVTVDYATADGTANAGVDYTAASGTLSFSADETSKTVAVRVLTDTTVENDETLTLTLSNAGGATIGDGTATGTVANVVAANRPATGAPSVSGTARVGETLVASTAGIADADGLSRAAFAYQWVSNDGTDADLAGATGAHLVLTQAHAGHAVKVRVTFVDDAGYRESLTSAATAPVAPAAPTITGVALSSRPRSGDTYGRGETVRVTLEMSEVVEVTGAPRLKLKLDTEHADTWATYENGTGTSHLNFAYTVAEPATSTRGVAVAANTLDANGGAIRSAVTQAHAEPSHAGLPHDAAHKVDTTPPAPVSAEVDGHVATVAFDEDLAPPASTDWFNFHWTITGTGVRHHPDSAWISGARTVSMRLARDFPAVAGQTVRLAYEPSDYLKDAAGNQVEFFAMEAENLTLPVLAVADAQAEEGTDATLDFVVRLNAGVDGTVKADYATADGTATAGEDYTAASGTLTFAAGERQKTVSVPILDDALDEGSETFTFRLSNADGATIGDGEATGTITNSDPIPRAWTARFGRTVSEHLVDALKGRLERPPSESWLQVGGHRLGGGPDVHDTVERLSPALRSSKEQALWDEEPEEPMGQTTTVKELLLGSAFHLLSNEGEVSGPRLSAWGRAATSSFDGQEEKVSLDGTVTTATLGVDGVWKRWLTGVAVAYSVGDGSFSHADLPGGDLESSLTSFHPYAAYTLSDRVRLWGMVGYGSGSLQLRLQDQSPLDTDLALTMGALGMRGTLLEPTRDRRLKLALRSDLLWTRTDSAATHNLAETQADVSRLRLVLEGSRPVVLAGGGSFIPTLELGLRHDGGDAETGTGVEVGGRLSYASAWGLSIEAAIRSLVAHQDTDYREWGASAALRFDPGHQGRGFTASIVPTWGQAASGVSTLWGQRSGAGLPGGGVASPAGRLDAEMGYGLTTLKGRGLLVPYARVALSEGAGQAWHLGTRLALRESLNLSLEASRRAVEGQSAAHEVALLANVGF